MRFVTIIRQTTKEGSDPINQHLCLFLTGNDLDEQKQKEFYYRMCTALGYDTKKAISVSTIYAHYGLFNEKPITESDYNAIEKRLKPCKDCSTLKRKPTYKSFPITENACSMCIFSTSYRNAREKDEMFVLRHLLKLGATYEYYQIDASNAFYSVKKLCKDYDIGSYPVIPFNLYLYLYLGEHSYQEMGDADFFDGLLKFIVTQLPVVFDIEQYRDVLRIALNSIVNIDEKTVSDDVYEISAGKLRTSYEYLPPNIVVQPVSSGTPSDIKRKKKRKKVHKSPEVSNQTSLFDLIEPSEFSSGADMQVPPIQETTLESVSLSSNGGEMAINMFSFDNLNNIEDPGELSNSVPEENSSTDCENTYEQSEPIDATPDAGLVITDTETNTDNPVPESTESQKEEAPFVSQDIFDDEEEMPFVSQTVSEEEEEILVNTQDVTEPVPDNFTACLEISANEGDIGLPNVSEIHDMVSVSSDVDEIMEPHLSLLEDANATIQNHESYTKLYDSYTFKHKNTITQPLDYFSCIDFSESFNAKINILSRNTSFCFVSKLDQNYSIAIEPVFLHFRSGFLLYLHLQNEYYFYDSEVFGNAMLEDYLKRTDTIAITSNPVFTMSLLHLSYENSPGLHSLDALYWLLNEHKEPLLPDIVDTYTNSVYDGNKDFFDYAMPLYQDCYLSMAEKIKDTPIITKYHRLLRLFSILSRTLDHSSIFHKRIAYLKQDGYLKYTFSFDWTNQIFKPGQVIRIGIDGIELDSLYDPDSFLADICLCFSSLHHTSQKHVHLLSISKKAVYIFYDGSYELAMRFYDSIMLRLQNAYQKRFKKPMNSTTTYVIYE